MGLHKLASRTLAHGLCGGAGPVLITWPLQTIKEVHIHSLLGSQVQVSGARQHRVDQGWIPPLLLSSSHLGWVAEPLVLLLEAD